MNALMAFGILAALLFLFSYAPALIAGDCPSRTYGTNNKAFIKYFSSPFCIACWSQKPVLESLEAEHGDAFLIEEYDVDSCRDAAKPNFVRGVPAFIFNNTVVYGYQDKEALKRMVGI